MKFNFKEIIPGIVIILLLGGVAFLYFAVIRKSQIAEISSAKRQAKSDYQEGRFVDAAYLYNHLIDSLKVDEEPVTINYANAGFLAAAIDTTLFSRQTPSRHEDNSDSLQTSTQQSILSRAEQDYLKLTGAKNKAINSMANNQLGVYLLKVDGASPQTQSDQTGKMADSLIQQSLAHFKEALKKNPENDSARYNYEMLKRKQKFPELVYNKAEDLVQRRRYGEAYRLMVASMKKDERMKKYEDYTKKLYSVYQIDSLKRLL